ncbi:MAG: hypothetical protein ABFD97_20020 [Syntrophobacter sp.]
MDSYRVAFTDPFVLRASRGEYIRSSFDPLARTAEKSDILECNPVPDGLIAGRPATRKGA